MLPTILAQQESSYQPLQSPLTVHLEDVQDGEKQEIFCALDILDPS